MKTCMSVSYLFLLSAVATKKTMWEANVGNVFTKVVKKPAQLVTSWSKEIAMEKAEESSRGTRKCR